MLDNLISGLAQFKTYRSRRVSSYDRTGGNSDWIPIKAGERVSLAQISGAGIVKHIWITVHCPDRNWPRSLVLRAWWDDEPNPSVESPIGDFFGVGHGKVSPFQSLPLNMVTGAEAFEQNHAAMNCFFPMPFRKSARFEIENQSDQDVVSFYYYIDYEEHDSIAEDLGYFHAQWRRENPTQGYETWHMDHKQMFVDAKNTTGKDNYVVMEAEGRGHYVGCVLSWKTLKLIG